MRVYDDNSECFIHTVCYSFSTSREYLLMLAPDLYSKRHTQWFYFELRGMVANESYTFHIANFLKPDSLYNYGEPLQTALILK